MPSFIPPKPPCTTLTQTDKRGKRPPSPPARPPDRSIDRITTTVGPRRAVPPLASRRLALALSLHSTTPPSPPPLSYPPRTTVSDLIWSGLVCPRLARSLARSGLLAAARRLARLAGLGLDVEDDEEGHGHEGPEEDGQVGRERHLVRCEREGIE